MMKKLTVTACALVLLTACGGRHKTDMHGVAGHHGSGEAAHEDNFANVVGHEVYFGFDSAALSTEAMNTLKRQASWLTEHPRFEAVVSGHTDSRGTKEYNMALGAKRATEVKNFLVRNGVEKCRIKTVSYGKERPVVMGENEAAWAKNRRTVTTIDK